MYISISINLYTCSRILLALSRPITTSCSPPLWQPRPAAPYRSCSQSSLRIYILCETRGVIFANFQGSHQPQAAAGPLWTLTSAGAVGSALPCLDKTAGETIGEPIVIESSPSPTSSEGALREPGARQLRVLRWLRQPREGVRRYSSVWVVYRTRAELVLLLKTAVFPGACGCKLWKGAVSVALPRRRRRGRRTSRASTTNVFASAAASSSSSRATGLRWTPLLGETSLSSLSSRAFASLRMTMQLQPFFDNMLYALLHDI